MIQNKEKIVICGHYGATNIGDEAILASLLQNLKKAKPLAEITVLSYNPSNTKEFHDIESNYLIPLGFRSLFRGIFRGELFKSLKIIKNCDKFILGGGGLFTDEKLFAVFLWGIHAFWALRYKKPLYMIGQSVGPLKSRIGKWITKKAFNKAKMISVRDIESKNLLEKLNVKKEINVMPDLVFGLDFEDGKFDENLNKIIEQNNLKGYFLISLRPWIKNSQKLYKNIEQVIARIVEKEKLLPIFIPFQTVHQNDEELMHNILEQSHAKYPFLIKKFDQNIFNIIQLIKQSKFVIGMRLHSIIFSIIAMTPFVAISYSSKVKNLLKDLKFQDLIIDKFETDYILNKINLEFSLTESQKSYISSAKSDILEFFKKI